MTDRNEMRAAAELVIGNPQSHTPTEVALAGMLLELVEAPIRFSEYDGTERFLRLDGGEPDACIAPSYVVDEGEADAFKRINLRLVELEFAKAQCEKFHVKPPEPTVTALPVGSITVGSLIAAFSDRGKYWLDIEGNRHKMDCRGGIDCRGRGKGCYGEGGN